MSACRCAAIPCPGKATGHDGHCCIRETAAVCHVAGFVADHLAVCPEPHEALRQSPTVGKESTS